MQVELHNAEQYDAVVESAKIAPVKMHGKLLIMWKMQQICWNNRKDRKCTSCFCRFLSTVKVAIIFVKII